MAKTTTGRAKTAVRKDNKQMVLPLSPRRAKASVKGRRKTRSSKPPATRIRVKTAKQTASSRRKVKHKHAASTDVLTAEQMARRQRDISVSEFFAKNRHLLGFDNPRRALLTATKEAVDNSLDACEEAGILPELHVVIEQLTPERFLVRVTDNGPGIVKEQIPQIFGRLLYGSKFHTLKMSRGQQGIGISAAGMYGLITTGKPVQIVSRTSARRPAHYYELAIDTKKNRPDIIKDEQIEWNMAHGTQVCIELEGRYQKGRQSVDEYLLQTALANPHATIHYAAPDGTQLRFQRVSNQLPPRTKTIKPHPYGIELGVLIRMLKETKHRNMTAFLRNEFSRVSTTIANRICERAGISASANPTRVARSQADAIHKAIQHVKIMAPAADCIAPIGEQNLLKSLQNIVQADFYHAVTRPPAVYRGNPFQVEAAIAYGNGEEKTQDKQNGELMRVLRFANRVPLLYQQSACSIYKSILQINWRNYGLSQAKGALPTGPATVMVHIVSVWVPFTSESKEAVVHYPEIIHEIKLALQQCGRQLGRYLNRRRRQADELKKRSYIEAYIPAIGEALKDILSLQQQQVNSLCDRLKGVLQRSRKL